jgi:hypothetical protein
MRPRKNPPAPRSRESRRGAGLIAASMLALALCVCATAAFSLADRLPRQVDRYLLTRPARPAFTASPMRMAAPVG